ncbi:unnamed protein product, partial [Effrenium voratum]
APACQPQPPNSPPGSQPRQEDGCHAVGKSHAAKPERWRREEIGAWPAPDPQKDHTKAVGQPPSRGFESKPSPANIPEKHGYEDKAVSIATGHTEAEQPPSRGRRPAEGSSPNLRQPISPRSTATRTRRCQLQQPRRWRRQRRNHHRRLPRRWRRQRRNHHRRLFASLALPWTSARRKARARRRRGGEGGPCCLLGV